MCETCTNANNLLKKLVSAKYLPYDYYFQLITRMCEVNELCVEAYKDATTLKEKKL